MSIAFPLEKMSRKEKIEAMVVYTPVCFGAYHRLLDHYGVV
jgi:hypothetical protein